MMLQTYTVLFGCFYDASCVADIIPYFDGSFDNFFKNIESLKEKATQDIKDTCKLILQNKEDIVDWIVEIFLYRIDSFAKRNKLEEYSKTLIMLNKINNLFNALMDLRSFYGKCKCKDISHIELHFSSTNDIHSCEIESCFHTAKCNKMPTIINELKSTNYPDERISSYRQTYAVAMSKEDFLKLLQYIKDKFNIYKLEVKVNDYEQHMIS